MSENAASLSRPRRACRRYPAPLPPQARDDDTIDYWEEVALARLRLAQLGLVAALAGSVVGALILG